VNVKIENFIGIYEDAFTKEYCESVIDYFDSSVKAGIAVDRQKDRRTSKLEKDDLQVYAHTSANLKDSNEVILQFNNTFWNGIYPNYSSTFAILNDYAEHKSYCFKVQKTEIGQGYHVWHSETTNREISNRILAWTLYLNDVEEGGETEFLYYPKRIKPKAGTLVLWPAGFTHTHRGNPPISNTKYIVTGWIEF
jgi:hypothetical protein